MPTEKRIVATGFALIGTFGEPSKPLAPGEYVVFQKDNVAHKAIEKEIDDGREAGLVIKEVDTDAEQASVQASAQEQVDAAEAQARALEEETRRAQAQAGEGLFNPEENNVSQVLDYMAQASPEEVDRVKRLEAASDRKSKRVADFETTK
jgi:hypothetical protein